MKRVKVATARGFSGTFRKWDFLTNGKIRLYRTDLPMPPKFGYPSSAYKDFNRRDVGFLEVCLYNKLERAIIKWLQNVIQGVMKFFGKKEKAK